MEHLTKDSFKDKVCDLTTTKEWNFKGTRPCIIDFYATWCGPCQMLSPVLEGLATEYAGKVDIYKIDTDKEPELAGLFGVTGVPSILFVPQTGKPQMAVGALPKEMIVRAMKDVLGVA